ncbi:MAG: hypothetical protein PUB52_12075 [Lachnospiraceae bacterium]|nr:hypothetical protein [Lachnospiraceae bacterium]MDD6505064.1 hypothetical protein [Lachnospiraceae bacterium]
MESILLIGIIIFIMAVGFYVSGKADCFMEEEETEKKSKEVECEFREPACVVISGDKPLMEIDAEIAEFRRKHKHVQVILRDESMQE